SPPSQENRQSQKRSDMYSRAGGVAAKTIPVAATAQSFTERAFSWAGSGPLGSQKASGSLFVARSPVSFSPSRLPATASTSPPTSVPSEGDALRGRNGATQNGIWNQLGAAD